MSNRWLPFSAAILMFGIPCYGQPVISARAGLIHFTDGLVFLDGQPIDQRPGHFEQMNEGSELRTHSGRAEVLLTPGAFVRLGANSSIRMISNRLVDTRVRFVDGTIIIDQDNPAPRTSLTIVYRGYQVMIGTQGRYRLNSEPAELKVENGEARVVPDGQFNSITVSEGYALPLSGAAVAKRFDPQENDSLENWNENRNEAVARDNQDAASTPDLQNAIDDWQKDPFAGLGGPGGIPLYIPPGGGYSSALPLYTPNVPWLSGPLAMGALSPYGFGFSTWFGAYPSLLLPHYSYYSPYRLPSVRGPLYTLPAPLHIPTTGVYRSPIYTGGTSLRPITPAPGGIHAVHAIGHR